MAKERFASKPNFTMKEVETILDGLPDIDKDAVVRSFWRHADQRFLELESQRRRDFAIQMCINYRAGETQSTGIYGQMLLGKFAHIKNKRLSNLQTSAKEAAAVAYSFSCFKSERSLDTDILDRAGVDEARLARQFGNGLREAHPRSKTLDEAAFVGIDDLQALPPVVTWSDREGAAILGPVFEPLIGNSTFLRDDFNI